MLKIFALLTVILAFSVSSLGASPTSYAIISHSIHDLGSVSIEGSSCSYAVNIPAAGEYDVDTGCPITSITINGQQVSLPNSGPIILPLGTKVSITWTSPSVVEIYDYSEIQSPTRQ